MIPWGPSEAGCRRQAPELWSGSPLCAPQPRHIHMGMKWHLWARPRTWCGWQRSLWSGGAQARGRALPSAVAKKHTRASQPGEAATRAGQRHQLRGFFRGLGCGRPLSGVDPHPRLPEGSRFQHKPPGLCQPSRHRESPSTGKDGRPEIQVPGRKLRATCAFQGGSEAAV